MFGEILRPRTVAEDPEPRFANGTQPSDLAVKFVYIYLSIYSLQMFSW